MTWAPFHGVRFKLNLTLHGLSQKLCTTIVLAHLAAVQIVGQGFWDWFGVQFSLSGTCKVPAYVRDQNVVVKATCRHLLDLSTYIKQCECCPQQWDPAVHRSTLCPSINLACLRIPTGPSQKTAQTNTTQDMESCLSQWPVKTLYPHY